MFAGAEFFLWFTCWVLRAMADDSQRSHMEEIPTGKDYNRNGLYGSLAGHLSEEEFNRSHVIHSRKKRSPYADFVFDLTQEERAKFVVEHNSRRSTVNPNATAMNKVVWSVGLEIQAQIWASYCTFEHGGHEPFDDYTSISQNLYVKSGWNVDNKPGPNQAMNSWWNEVNGYTYSDMSCSGGCGHYTLMAWDWVSEIGCARNYCPPPDQPIYIAPPEPPLPRGIGWIIVCMYAEGGNRAGRHPYHEGEPCSDCPETHEGGCVDNLCIPTTPCLGITCENGGTLNNETCLCDGCPEGTVGAFCQGVPTPERVCEISSGHGYGKHNGEGTYPPFVDWWDCSPLFTDCMVDNCETLNNTCDGTEPVEFSGDNCNSAPMRDDAGLLSMVLAGLLSLLL